MYLALKEDGLATIAEVAQSYGVSKNHLMKVAYQLGVAGYIETIRGRSGGLRLAKSPKAIILGEVVRRTEPDMAIVTCFKPIMPFAQFNLAASYAALSSVRRPHLLMCLMVILSTISCNRVRGYKPCSLSRRLAVSRRAAAREGGKRQVHERNSRNLWPVVQNVVSVRECHVRPTLSAFITSIFRHAPWRCCLSPLCSFTSIWARSAWRAPSRRWARARSTSTGPRSTTVSGSTRKWLAPAPMSRSGSPR